MYTSNGVKINPLTSLNSKIQQTLSKEPELSNLISNFADINYADNNLKVFSDDTARQLSIQIRDTNELESLEPIFTFMDTLISQKEFVYDLVTKLDQGTISKTYRNSLRDETEKYIRKAWNFLEKVLGSLLDPNLNGQGWDSFVQETKVKLSKVINDNDIEQINSWKEFKNHFNEKYDYVIQPASDIEKAENLVTKLLKKTEKHSFTIDELETLIDPYLELNKYVTNGNKRHSIQNDLNEINEKISSIKELISYPPNIKLKVSRALDLLKINRRDLNDIPIYVLAFVTDSHNLLSDSSKKDSLSKMRSLIEKLGVINQHIEEGGEALPKSHNFKEGTDKGGRVLGLKGSAAGGG